MASIYVKLPIEPVSSGGIASNVNVISSVLPTGASTSALQNVQSNKLDVLHTDNVSTQSKIDTSNVILVEISSKLTAPISTAVTNFPATQAVSGTVTVSNPGLTDAQLRASAVPISAASLPLPSGASTAANQVSGNASIASIDSKTPVLGQALASGSHPVVLTAAQLTTLTPLSSVSISNFPATQPVSAASLPLPTGAATEVTLASINTKLPSGLTVTANRLQVELPVGGTGLTNAELRASPVPISGTVAISNLTSGVGFSTVSVSTQVSVGVTSTTLIAANASRKYFHIFNHGTATAYIQYAGVAALNRGIKLNIGAMLTLSGYDLFLGQINAISASTINLDILEGV